MKTHPRRFCSAFLFCFLLSARIGAAPANPTPLNDAPKTPNGLTAADWSGIRVAAATAGNGAIAQQAYLKASNTGAGIGVRDQFGLSVAVWGDTVVVGAFGEDSNATGVNGNQSNDTVSASGAVYVFVRSGGTWVQQAYLKASNTGLEAEFGKSVAISGDTIVVGARAEDSDATGVNAPLTGGSGTQDDRSAPQSGAAYVFVRNGAGVWTQQAYLKASNTAGADQFGLSVSVSGDTVVVGSPWESSNATGVNGDQNNNNAAHYGAAYVFARNGTTWTQQAYLKASNTGISGQSGDLGDQFGTSVAVSGNTVVVGAFEEDSNATGVNAPRSGGSGTQADNSAANSGAAYVFVRSGTGWTQQAYLKASNTGTGIGVGDRFGFAVAVSGDTVVVGAYGEDSLATGVNGDESNDRASSVGAAYVFARSGATWTQQAYLKASNSESSDEFGKSVAVSGDTVVVGARNENGNATGVNGNQSTDPSNNTASGSGSAYVFVRSGATWIQQAYLKASNTGGSDNFGLSVAVSAGTVVVGAYGEASAATGVDGNQDDNSFQYAGAAYVFTGLGPTLNRPPVAPDQTFTRGEGLPLTIRIADVLAATSDPDGGSPTLAGLGTSVFGATISRTTTDIVYSLAENADDSFPYTIDDGQGGTATGTLNVLVVPSGGRILSITVGAGGGSVTLNCAGIPGFLYEIQRAPVVTGPWTAFGAQTAPANGLFSHIDASAQGPEAYYRLRHP